MSEHQEELNSPRSSGFVHVCKIKARLLWREQREQEGKCTG